jgi:predicted nucleotidyltransferase
MLVWRAGRHHVKTYWQLDFAERSGGSYGQCVEMLRAAIARSVTRQMVAEVPVGSFLSDGDGGSGKMGQFLESIILTVQGAMEKILDAETERAARAFIDKVAGQYDLAGAILFGSRARRSHHTGSDADIAVLLHGAPGHRVDVALSMASIAFDVMLDTGVLVEAIPLWEDEWDHPERFSNPALIENIRREGVRL